MVVNKKDIIILLVPRLRGDDGKRVVHYGNINNQAANLARHS